VVLLHGDDPGLIRERAERLVRAVAGGDAMRLVEVPRDGWRDPGLLAAEAASVPLTGGRPLVRVRDAGDGFAPAAKAALAGPGPGVVVLEAPEAQARSKLRTLLEPAPAAAVIACYRERGADLARSVGAILGELGASAEPAAMDWLAQRLGEDRMLLRRELEKLALYVGEGGKVGVEDAVACVAEGSALGLEEALTAAMSGDLATADRALETAFAEGANAVQVVRAALRHVQRLHLASWPSRAGRRPARRWTGCARRSSSGTSPPSSGRSASGARRRWKLPGPPFWTRSAGPRPPACRAPRSRAKRSCAWLGRRRRGVDAPSALEQPDHPVELIEVAVLDGHLAAAPGLADGDFQAEAAGEPPLQRRDLRVCVGPPAGRRRGRAAWRRPAPRSAAR
jgi:DNA polymerase-3 subunit delta